MTVGPRPPSKASTPSGGSGWLPVPPWMTGGRARASLATVGCGGTWPIAS